MADLPNYKYTVFVTGLEVAVESRVSRLAVAEAIAKEWYTHHNGTRTVYVTHEYGTDRLYEIKAKA